MLERLDQVIILKLLYVRLQNFEMANHYLTIEKALKKLLKEINN